MTTKRTEHAKPQKKPEAVPNDDPIVQKSIRMPKSVWERLENEAKYWLRSESAQIEFTLQVVFGMRSPQVDLERLALARAAMASNEDDLPSVQTYKKTA